MDATAVREEELGGHLGGHLVGALARAGAGTVGAVGPALLAFGVKDRVAIGVLAGAFFAAAIYFLLERRDRGWLRCVGVTACLTLLASALVPVAVQAALTHDPRAPSAWTTGAVWTLGLSAQRLLDPEHVLRSLPSSLWLSAWPLVRTRTSGVAAQVTAGALAAAFAVLGGPLLTGRPPGELAVPAALLSGGLVAGAVAGLERTRWLARVDPGRPGPTDEDARPIIACWFFVAVTTAAGAPRAGPVRHGRSRPGVVDPDLGCRPGGRLRRDPARP